MEEQPHSWSPYLAKMESGDTEFFELCNFRMREEAMLLRAEVHRRFGTGNYMTRTVIEDGLRGVRVWRTG